MRVGIPKESAATEHRVALVPETVGRLGEGVEVIVEAGAGAEARLLGRRLRRCRRDGRRSVAGRGRRQGGAPRPPTRFRSSTPGRLLIAFLQPLTDQEGVERLRARGVHGLALESIPRTTRAQPMDALSSQATVAGYKAVLLAADRLPRFMPMLMTAAGTIPPAQGAWCSAPGSPGCRRSRPRDGSAVSSRRSTCVRPCASRSSRSAPTFLDLGVVGTESAGGYAQELTAEQQAEQQAELQARIPQFDVVITTAAIPGRPAPVLVTAEAVRGMRAGSVIVDLAAETGGNCELTVPGSEIVESGVTIVGFVDVPSLMPTHASQLLSRNVASLVGLLVRDGELVLDWDDDIVARSCVTRTEGV